MWHSCCRLLDKDPRSQSNRRSRTSAQDFEASETVHLVRLLLWTYFHCTHCSPHHADYKQEHVRTLKLINYVTIKLIIYYLSLKVYDKKTQIIVPSFFEIINKIFHLLSEFLFNFLIFKYLKIPIQIITKSTICLLIFAKTGIYH